MDCASYVSLLGCLFYGTEEIISSAWGRLDAEGRKAFLKRSRLDGVRPFVYRRLKEAGVEGLEKSQLQSLSQSKSAIFNQIELNRFCEMLDEHCIRYALIKGVDLAYRVYPAPALRSFSDWDVLFHYDDIKRALELLVADGWLPETPLTNDIPAHFHYPICRKNGISMEPHWTLPMFQNCSPEQIWNFIHPIAEGSGHNVIEPELNLLLATRHAAERFYTQVPLGRMLLDIAYITASDDFDWGRSHDVSVELNQPCPSDLIAAFPEFFPKSVLAGAAADSECAKAYRRIFETRESIGDKSNEEWFVNSSQAMSSSWIKRRLGHCAFSQVRQRHGLPSEGHSCTVLFHAIKDAFSKSFNGTKAFFQRDKILRQYMELIDSAENKGNKPTVH